MIFPFMIRETLTMRVEIEAASFEAARAAVEKLHGEGEYNLDRNCYAGVEFRPCCSKCESDFDDDGDGLREINAETPIAMFLCDRCVTNMEDNHTLTRCDCCEDLFSPSRLRVNPENRIQEICPECGEVWCD